VRCAILYNINLNFYSMGILFYSSEVIRFFGIVIEYIGLAFIIISVVTTLGRLFVRKRSIEDVRADFAHKIIFGLEFVIAADILLATVTTELSELIQLGGIVVIRILLGYALHKEAIE